MRLTISCAVLLALTAVVVADDKKDDRTKDDTPAATKTRELLKKKITIDSKDTMFKDLMGEIKDEVKGLSIRWDKTVSNNKKFTIKAKDKTVAEILDEVCKQSGDLGYYVRSKKGHAYDGSVEFRKSDERGFEKK